MYRSLFPRDMFAEMDRLQREMQQAFALSPTIRGFARNGFPALNVGGTAKTLEIYACQRLLCHGRRVWTRAHAPGNLAGDLLPERETDPGASIVDGPDLMHPLQIRLRSVAFERGKPRAIADFSVLDARLLHCLARPNPA